MATRCAGKFGNRRRQRGLVMRCLARCPWSSAIDSSFSNLQAKLRAFVCGEQPRLRLPSCLAGE
eukprot:scaffold114286_cov63-Phaeocystis_antarctica.AAC.7